MKHYFSFPRARQWRKSLICLLFISGFVLTACNSVSSTSSLSPTQAIFPQSGDSPNEFASRKNSFGDGYIAYIFIKEVKDTSSDEIVNLLVSQWLEHYKTESTTPDAILTDYTVDKITLTEKRNENDPSILAWVQFSILPAQTPNPWASLPGETINAAWWHLEVLFGVYEDESGVYWLKIVPIG